MISFESIKGFFPEELRAGQFAKHILKEYVECLALEWIARSPSAAKLTFIVSPHSSIRCNIRKSVG